MHRSVRSSATIVLACLIASSANATDHETQAAATQPDAAAEYRMHNQGAEPRRPLRHEPKIGQRAILKWTTESESVRVIDGVVTAGKPFPLPSIEIGMEVTHVANGEITQRIQLLEFEIAGAEQEKPDADNDAMRTAIAKVRGKVGEFTTDARGRFVRGGFDPSQFDASMQPAIQQMNQQFSSMCIPLPAEPVGVGAEWAVAREIIGAVTKTNIRASYRITAIEGSAVTMEIGASQNGVPLSNTSSVREIEGVTYGVMSFDLQDISRLSSRTTGTMVILQEIATKQSATKIKVENSDRTTMTISTAPWPLADTTPDEGPP